MIYLTKGVYYIHMIFTNLHHMHIAPELVG